jgi:hypothetical protein
VGQQSYNQLQPGIQNSLLNTISDPFTAMGYQQQLAGASAQAAAGSNASGAAASMGARGITGSSGVFQRQLENAGNSFRSNQNSLNNNLLLQAGNLSTAASIAATQYQPQQTGQNTSNQTGGIGSYI